jgi:hypothetical protein
MSLKTLASLTRCAMPRDYYGNHYLYGASPERVAEEISKLEMRRAEERAAGIDKLHERAAKLKLLLKDTEPPDMDLDEDLRGPYVLANLDPVEGKGVGYYHAHFPGVSLKFIEEQLTQIEAEGPNGPRGDRGNGCPGERLRGKGKR